VLDLEEKYIDLEGRVKTLEAATLSGVPEQSIAARFETQYDRISTVANNINATIKREVGAVRTEMKADFTTVRTEMKAGFAAIDERLGEIDHRYSLLSAEIDSLKSSTFEVSLGITALTSEGKRRDLRIDKIEKRLDGHDERLDRIEALLVRIDAKLPDQQPS
jgi:chromosome segregation ATPase